MTDPHAHDASGHTPADRHDPSGSEGRPFLVSGFVLVLATALLVFVVIAVLVL